MIATIIIIAGFQVYWLNKLYEDEKQGLKKEADILFRESIFKLQMDKLQKDTLFKKLGPDNFLLKIVAASGKIAASTDSMSFTYTESSGRKGDSAVKGRLIKDRIFVTNSRRLKGDDKSFFITTSLAEGIKPAEIDSSFRKALKNAKVSAGFKITSHKVEGNPKIFVDSVEERSLKTNFEIIGMANPMAYQAELNNATFYLMGEIAYLILVSLLLIILTTASFVFLYRNLLAQRRLTDVKNEFISNITHELKTPIATVNVAIEAMKNFNAMDDPERTKEYLDISSSELQRLSLLVDKVLKLSLFENKEIELRKETFDLKQLTEEVIKTMQLQLQKKKAELNFIASGENFLMEGDKLHITSVVYNLIDNALKYSPDQPRIDVSITENRNTLEIKVTDNGIGIHADYKDKIFDKFFRVPHGNTHNIKGYGLGLSYAYHVVQKHNGSIEVESEEGKGTTFTINLLKQA